jgi:hypothetical protein
MTNQYNEITLLHENTVLNAGLVFRTFSYSLKYPSIPTYSANEAELIS